MKARAAPALDFCGSQGLVIAAQTFTLRSRDVGLPANNCACKHYYVRTYVLENPCLHWHWYVLVLVLVRRRHRRRPLATWLDARVEQLLCLQVARSQDVDGRSV